MITLERNELVFRFPEIHKDAELTLTFERTLRVPDDGKDYPLPATFGHFPLAHVEDYELPETWKKRGGAIMPMYQSEAMWINFRSRYPMAIKIAAGKINAVTGENWTNGLSREPQDYVAVPEQPWLDGFKSGDDVVSQFVASPLGSGQSAEEQITGAAEFGGVQIVVYPLKAEVYEREQKERERELLYEKSEMIVCSMSFCESSSFDMGLGLGGKIKQEIYEDEHSLDEWSEHYSRCYVHLVNSAQWNAVTGKPVPHAPISAAEYKSSGIPWFDYYNSELQTLKASNTLGALKTFKDFPENESALASDTGIFEQVQGKKVTDGSF